MKFDRRHPSTSAPPFEVTARPAFVGRARLFSSLLCGLVVGCGLVQVNGKTLGGEPKGSAPLKESASDSPSSDAERAPVNRAHPRKDAASDASVARDRRDDTPAPAVPTVDHGDGAVRLPARFAPAFVLAFFDCALATGGAKADVYLACAREKRTSMICRWVSNNILALDVARDGSVDAFAATIETDRASKIAFSTPRAITRVRIEPQDYNATLVRSEASPQPGTCKGRYLTTADYKEMLREGEKAVAKQQEERERQEAADGAADDEPRGQARDTKAAPKGIGEQCAWNDDCKSKHCGTLSSGQLHKCVSKP